MCVASIVSKCISGPMLKLKTREQDSAPPHKPLSQVGQQRKNPFRLGSQVTPKAAQGTSVFDSMQRSSSKSKSLPTTTEIKPKPIKLKKQVRQNIVAGNRIYKSE